MKPEIEAKFLDVDFDDIRDKLKKLGATCEQPMRLMKRAIINYSDKKLYNDDKAFVRVRDEGNKITLTYKSHAQKSVDGAREIEVEVSDFDKTVELFEKIGLEVFSIQETKRETWRLGQAEVMLDEWPWLKPYIEIEASDVETVQMVAQELGFSWDNAVFGGVMPAYRAQYPNLDPDFKIGDVPDVRFGDPVPDLFKQ